MRKVISILALLVMTSNAAQAEIIRATINGMVCAFCVAGIEKKFKEQPAVEQVKVDLDSKIVTIHTKEKMDDETVTKVVTDAGYTVTKITRGKE